jgi:RNA polymerase sigma-70 factor (ECF subfamily)
VSERPTDEESLWVRLCGGDSTALAPLFELYRPRLRRMVQLRLDPRAAARLDASDVLQETYLDAAGRVGEYVHDPRVCAFVWLRGLAWQRLLKLHRQHLGAGCRAAVLECPLPEGSDERLAAVLRALGDSPSQALDREESRRRVRRALDALAPDDREVILLRDFEGLSNSEVAQLLGIGRSGATMRYGRALFRLKELLCDPGAAPATAAPAPARAPAQGGAL